MTWLRSCRIAGPPPRQADQRPHLAHESLAPSPVHRTYTISQFIGTYWPVGDASAAMFAKTFYGEVLRGAAIGPALVAARQVIADGKATPWDWADFMHYGDPKFALKSTGDRGT